MRIGVLALQGDVREHVAALGDLGEDAVLVRRRADLVGLGGIILPGGESTTLSMLLESSGLFGPLGDALAAGLPAFGTCAGLVLLSSEVLGGRPDQRVFGQLHCTVRRNGYGRQVNSFETAVPAMGVLDGGAGPLPAVFIRAPVVVDVGPEVEVLAVLGRGDGEPASPVVCRQGAVLATTFHPELTGDRRLHRVFLGMVGAGPVVGAPPVAGSALSGPGRRGVVR
ncbi:MAG TPA: pyridoxal 5'-phosphate synthase glutaminase subunit PdxT [Acidimicrobiales bacterium]|nr:pyridoxal 5'-phosphate synthase glutaminase subunit PdxT [Acidimicrobiales bacterium]